MNRVQDHALSMQAVNKRMIAEIALFILFFKLTANANV